MTGQSRDADKFVVRLSEGMRARVNAVASTQHLSMNSYIIRAVDEALRVDEGGGEVRTSKITPGPGMPCRWNDQIGIVGKVYFQQGILTCDLITSRGEGWTVLYDLVEAY